MDTRSSSGSGSHSTNLNFNHIINQDRQRTPQHGTYTTAGTVYNPQTAPTLHPPARRGRASRWPPGNPADFSAFTNPVLGTLSRTRYRSPPTTASTLRQYSPLQQNQDRAIDPRYSADQHRPATSLSNPMRSTSGGSSNVSLSLSNTLPREVLADELAKSIICDCCGKRFNTTAMTDFHATLTGHDNFSEADDHNDTADRDTDTFLQEEEMKEEENLSQFNNYSVKTLTNLASYPNPNQKMAQRCLDRARETFKAAAEHTRPASNNSSRPGLIGAGASSSSYLSGSGRESSEYYSRVPRNAHMNSSTRSSVLSNGPGAPQPLTAGPPGQRHYKASTLEGPLRALQESAQKPYTTTMAESRLGTNPPNPSFLSGLSKPMLNMLTGASREAERETKPIRPLRGSNSPLSMERLAHNAPRTMCHETRHHNGPIVLPSPRNIWTNGMRETRTQEELSEYYPDSCGCLPVDYSRATLLNVPDDNSDLQPPVGRVLPSELEARIQSEVDLTRHRKRFYAGDSQVFRPWEFRFDEIREKIRNRELGTVDDDDDDEPSTLAEIETAVDLSQLGKPRNIPAHLISQLQPHDAARPLLPMLYSTLADLKNDCTGCDGPQKRPEYDSWGCPRPGYVGQEREEGMMVKADRSRQQTPFQRESPRW
ncbi:hypothetical protein N0V93_009129 [Gnomoniopsis smithogilvyi]|uniref:C2H2-type domain-containing protein n=1 Tax=Gnomoniopsis smithogilvyi TaxID=1191159 RepID=A0A9W8YKJ5_9PEZI|nr:hypothetical protein N0V93_009129 [Gnomoniopsis smithogilvyi]